MSITHLKEQEFESKILKDPQPSVILFITSWSGPCLALEKTFRSLAEEHEEKAHYFIVDVDQSPALVGQFNIRHVPYMAFIKNGMKVGELIGNQSRQVIYEGLKAMVAAL